MTKSTFSPIGNNPFKSRADVQDAFVNVFEPLLPAFSEGGARVRVEETGAFCDIDSSDLEGFSRPLWGLVPFVAGGGKFDHWDLIHKGITNGTDPDHPEYWGDTEDLEQRLVEFAAIGFALAYIPDQFYEPLSEKAKENFKKYLVDASFKQYPTTNWKWFHVLLTLGLKKIGANYDQSITEQNLEDMEEYYLKDGWYGDGPDKQAIDYYNPWAFHFYGLMYSKLYPEDTKRNAIYQERVKKFVNEFIHWFSDDGAALPFGRSLVYKWCCGSFWGALAFADQELLPWGVLKGLYLRHLRWWGKQPISRASSGLMSLGFAYPNAIVCERYNSPQSPYWGGKIFFPLALPADHPFWTAEELPIPRPQHKALPVPGMVFSHYPNNSVALVSGPYQNGSYVRFQGEKYCKFAYSTRYAFSVEVNDRNFVDATLDNMIAFSEDGDGYRFRTKTPVARIAGDILYSKWNPWKNVNVETWLIPAGKWHVRVHRILSDRDLITVEGGFAINALQAAKELIRVTDKNTAYVINKDDFSGIVDLTGAREGITTLPEPSTNLYFSKTLVPQLKGTIKANTVTYLSCAVLAQPDVTLVDNDWKSVPTAPTEEELERIIKTSVPVLSKE